MYYRKIKLKPFTWRKLILLNCIQYENRALPFSDCHPYNPLCQTARQDYTRTQAQSLREDELLYRLTLTTMQCSRCKKHFEPTGKKTCPSCLESERLRRLDPAYKIKMRDYQRERYQKDPDFRKKRIEHASNFYLKKTNATPWNS